MAARDVPYADLLEIARAGIYTVEEREAAVAELRDRCGYGTLTEDECRAGAEVLRLLDASRGRALAESCAVLERAMADRGVWWWNLNNERPRTGGVAVVALGNGRTAPIRTEGLTLAEALAEALAEFEGTELLASKGGA